MDLVVQFCTQGHRKQSYLQAQNIVLHKFNLLHCTQIIFSSTYAVFNIFKNLLNQYTYMQMINKKSLCQYCTIKQLDVCMYFEIPSQKRSIAWYVTPEGSRHLYMLCIYYYLQYVRQVRMQFLAPCENTCKIIDYIVRHN